MSHKIMFRSAVVKGLQYNGARAPMHWSPLNIRLPKYLLERCNCGKSESIQIIRLFFKYIVLFSDMISLQLWRQRIGTGAWNLRTRDVKTRSDELSDWQRWSVGDHDRWRWREWKRRLKVDRNIKQNKTKTKILRCDKGV